MTKVKCSVKSCIYWKDGLCNANTIKVGNNVNRDFNQELSPDDMEIAGQVDYEPYGGVAILEGNEILAASSSETCCETMRPRKEIKKM